MKNKLFAVLLMLSVATGAFEKALAQHSPNPLPNPAVVDPPWNWLQIIFMNNTFRIGGVEAGISTYSHHIGLPVFWVQNQLKLAPQLGWFWNRPESWDTREIYGGRVLYYLNNQQTLMKGDINPYAGGFGMVSGSGHHNSGVVVGMEPFISRYFKVGFEVHAGLRTHQGEDKAFAGAGIIVGFGW